MLKSSAFTAGDGLMLECLVCRAGAVVAAEPLS